MRTIQKQIIDLENEIRRLQSRVGRLEERNVVYGRNKPYSGNHKMVDPYDLGDVARSRREKV